MKGEIINKKIIKSDPAAISGNKIFKKIPMLVPNRTIGFMMRTILKSMSGLF